MAKYGDHIEYRSHIAGGALPGVEVDFQLDGVQMYAAFNRAINAHREKSSSYEAPSTTEILRILLDIAETEIPAA